MVSGRRLKELSTISSAAWQKMVNNVVRAINKMIEAVNSVADHIARH